MCHCWLPWPHHENSSSLVPLNIVNTLSLALKATSASRSLANFTQESMSLSGLLLTSTSRANEVSALIDFYNIHKGRYQFLVISCLTFDLWKTKSFGRGLEPGLSLSTASSRDVICCDAFSFDTQGSFPYTFHSPQKDTLSVYTERGLILE